MPALKKLPAKEQMYDKKDNKPPNGKNGKITVFHQKKNKIYYSLFIKKKRIFYKKHLTKLFLSCILTVQAATCAYETIGYRTGGFCALFVFFRVKWRLGVGTSE